MAGNPDNVKLYTEADVLLWMGSAAPTATDLPAAITDPFVTTTGKWAFLGLLVGDAGIDTQREWDEKDIPAWGYGTIIVASKDFKLTRKVSALEDNPAMQRILWNGSTETEIVVPNPLYEYVAFEKRTASGEIRREISKRPARFWTPNIKDAEGDATPREIECRIFPDSARKLFAAQQTAA
ncbi:hypothetical protein [Mycobacteroides abscessus]|uniref:hypothetical protein n=1 Tax=Mycobacteroides abscessus TaxID=36809 RepID=UPI0009291974|nr:hypothetical protein [Mycobacteroides abscessus]SIF54112.1 Uncharacterised protein [Mycobacteroides abscessus subsp. abscessus]SKW59095.1 Uncharacterised protein [Mycobacteroides abscessus subsp. abscessus]SKW84483.1 Uncharacterised protein [Mycobacteroides abscessus subsp. abscessus]